MDTRRRSRDSLPPSSERDEATAELIELSPVPRRHGPSMRSLAVAALALFAAGVLTGRVLLRPGADGVANASPTASPGPTASRAPVVAATTEPSTPPTPQLPPRPTPRGTPVPWAWTRGSFATEEGIPQAIWGTGGDIVVWVAKEGQSAFRVSDDGVTWSTQTPSRAVTDIAAGAVIDDALWLVLRVADVDGTHFEISRPAFGADLGSSMSWVTLGPAIGTPPDWVGIFGRVGETWIMSHGQYSPDGLGDGGVEELWVSDDAVHWKAVRPDGLEPVAYYHAAMLGSTFIAIGELPSGPVALSTRDGRNWTSAPFPGESTSAPFDMACGDAACVAIGSITPSGTDVPAAWITTDGTTWRSVATDIRTTQPQGLLSSVVATSRGFIAISYAEHDAWLSSDGDTWVKEPVLAPDDFGTVYTFMANGDVLFALGEEEPFHLQQWIGSVGALPFP